MKVRKLTLSEHKELGIELCKIRNRIQTISIKVSNMYTKKLGKTGHKAQELLDRLRSDMEAQLYRDYPEMSDNDKNLDIYYPGREVDKITITL